MKLRNRLALCVLIVIVAAGCASTKVTQQTQATSLKIPRPNHIWVYDFIATPSDAPANSDVALPSEPQTPEQIELGRQLGAQIAQELAAQIQEMGLPAAVASSATSPKIGDIVIRGYLISIDEGNAVKRVAIGFGSGGSEMTTAVEGYVMTGRGLSKLGSGTVESGGSKTPGGAPCQQSLRLLPAILSV